MNSGVSSSETPRVWASCLGNPGWTGQNRQLRLVVRIWTADESSWIKVEANCPEATCSGGSCLRRLLDSGSTSGASSRCCRRPGSRRVSGGCDRPGESWAAPHNAAASGAVSFAHPHSVALSWRASTGFSWPWASVRSAIPCHQPLPACVHDASCRTSCQQPSGCPHNLPRRTSANAWKRTSRRVNTGEHEFSFFFNAGIFLRTSTMSSMHGCYLPRMLAAWDFVANLKLHSMAYVDFLSFAR